MKAELWGQERSPHRQLCGVPCSIQEEDLEREIINGLLAFENKDNFIFVLYWGL